MKIKRLLLVLTAGGIPQHGGDDHDGDNGGGPSDGDGSI